jgi:iron complex outermembrane receptor protein
MLTLPLAAAVSSALAQNTEVTDPQASANNVQLEETLVTARKRTENLQDVPMSINAFGSEALERLDIVRMAEVVEQVPNMTFISGEAGRLNTPVIRGMALIDSRGFDNNVGVFIDGVYVSGRAAQDIGLLDVERVEVIKGPQSSLYGRNTFAGAVNFVTRNPTEELSGNVSLTLGEDNLTRVQAAVSGPLIENTLSGRISVGYLDDDGTYDNENTSRNLDGANNETVAATLMYTPNDNTEILLDLYYADEQRDTRALQLVDNNCGERVATATSTSFEIGQPYYYCGTLPSFDADDVSLSPAAFSSDGETKKVALRMNFELNGGYLLNSVTAFTENESIGFTDLDRGQEGGAHYGYGSLEEYEALGSPGIIFSNAPYIPSNYMPVAEANFNTYIGSQGLDQKYWEQELRLSSPEDRRLRWTAGLFYFEHENDQTSSLNIDVSDAVAASGLSPDELVFFTLDTGATGFPGGEFALPHPLLGQQYEVSDSTALWTDGLVSEGNLTLSEQEVEQYAVFGSVDYDFTDTLTATAELRWTSETRTLRDVKDDFFFTVPPSIDYEVDDDYWDPRFTLRYTPKDDLMFYGSAAHGTRSGGINGNLTVDDEDILYFDKETNWTYELGAKTTWFDNRLQIDAAVFYIDWEDAQFRQRLTDSNGAFLTATTNSTGLTVEGIEFTFVTMPIEGLRISGGAGYSSAEFESGTLYSGGAAFCELADPADSAYPGTGVNCVADPAGSGDFFPDMSGAQPKRSSDTTANLDIQYSRPFSNDMFWFVGANGAYRSEQAMDEMELAWVPERTIANVNAGINGADYNVTLWVKNVFDEDAPEYSQNFTTDLNVRIPTATIVGIPRRRIGITARYNF